MKRILIRVATVLALVVVLRCERSFAGAPNIVFIIADDLGWADVGFHGGNAPTPHLDQLASTGLELTQHYVAPVCSPTRAGLLTGRCWSRFNVTNPQNELALPFDTVTLPRALKKAGYETCLTGKWHLGSLPKWGPNHFGFDHSYGSLAGGVSPWNHFYKKGPYVTTWHRDEALIEEEGHVTDLITNEAVQWITSRTDQPFFLYVPFTAVHLPVKEPTEWLARVPAEIQGEVPRHYAASIMHLDDAVGQIVRALEATHKRDNTLVVFTSDNGGSWAQNNDLKYPDDHCPNGRLPGNNLPLRGQKGTLYEGGTRVPTIVNWPGQIKAGKAESPVQIIDWMPTFCRLAGFVPTSDLKWDGIDLTSLLTEGTVPVSRPLYTVAPGWRGRSVRLGNWKLIELKDGAKVRYELYNLSTDPQESDDQSQVELQHLAELQSTLQQISKRDQDAVAKK
ncbi:MAG: sulfatase-like hydrolase/transferase [Planctomycetaceae bacterium]|nr:sulfatase-like hydrolase/transferase [Planctomycetaceae bacterium]